MDRDRIPGPARRRNLARGLMLAGTAPLFLACGEAEEASRSPEPTPVDEQVPGEASPGVLYRTELTFVGTGGEPSVVHLRFDNRTDSTSIRLRYRGWFGGDEWRGILDQTDSLPVPKAAWRILPSGPVRVLAGEGGEPASVIVNLAEGRLRLDTRGGIGTWISSTGQRESLRLAELLDESGAESGLLLARQSARRIDDPPTPAAGQTFLVTDTAGNGLLIMRDSTAPDAPVLAWTWFEDTEAEWTDALVLTLASSEESPGRWSFELPEAGLLGELRGVPPVLADPTDEGSGFEVFRVEAALLLEGQSWAMRGIGMQGQSRE